MELVEDGSCVQNKRLYQISHQMGTPEVARDAERLASMRNTSKLNRYCGFYDEWARVSQSLPPPIRQSLLVGVLPSATMFG